VEAEPIPLRMQRATQFHFRLRVAPADPGHHS
jgi:hypothetical protein